MYPPSITHSVKPSQKTKKKPKTKTELEIHEIQENLKETVQQYVLNTSLHGLRYIGDKKLSIFERYVSFKTSNLPKIKNIQIPEASFCYHLSWSS